MSKKLIKVWVARLNKDLLALGLRPITVSQFRKAHSGNTDVDEIINVITSGGVRYAA